MQIEPFNKKKAQSNSPRRHSAHYIITEVCAICAAHTSAVSDSSVRTYHSFLPDDGHPVLHSVHSVGDLGEVVLAESLLAQRKGAVVRPRHTEIITGTFDG